jgi:L-seryl-tRNA(Ser) seleniumtransferase
VPIDYCATDSLRRIERAITSKTAAIGYVWLEVEERPDVAALAELAHRHGLPLIVDAACALPPVENLSSFSRRGADLVAYSGGKHLGGPQASGILCGRADLIRSAWLQMVDMDVRPGTWSLERWVASSWIAAPPRHGIGRSMKVSKEAIVGLMAALERYGQRDHAAEHQAWSAAIDAIHNGLRDLSGLRITRHDRGLNGQPHPILQIESGEAPGGRLVRDLLLALRNRPRRILLSEDEESPNRAFVFPHCLAPDDAQEIVAAVREFAALAPASA